MIPDVERSAKITCREVAQSPFAIADVDAELTQLGAPAAPSAIDPHGSLWWCHGSERVPQTRFELAGLPDPGTAVSMVLGAGSEHNQEA